MSVLRALVAGAAGARVGAGSRHPPPRRALLISIKPLPSDSVTIDPELQADVDSYIAYLDSLRWQNAKLSLKEQKKFDVMTVIAISLGTTAAIFGFLSNDDGDKSKVAGVTGAGSAFITALIAKFRHGEDAEQARACAKQLERILGTFRYPADVAEFGERRDSIMARLTQGDCFAPDTR